MPRVLKSVLVPYSAQRMYELVDDIERYPEFVPWCGGAEVLARQTDGKAKTARLDIDYHGVRSSFTTDNIAVPGQSIAVLLKAGPFRQLNGEWTFKALAPEASKVEFALAYEFSTVLLEGLVGPVFSHIANTFIDAFVARAEATQSPPVA